MTSTPDLLRAIVEAARRIVATRRALVPLDRLARRSSTAVSNGPGFEAALRRADRINVIAECKRRSPSKGVLAATYDPAGIAASYEQGGAAAISVLTEPTFFDGSLEHLAAVRRAVRVPLLRKDFIVDAYQLHEARVHGADAILLIVAALEQTALTSLHRQASELGLAAVVEVHDEAELDRAIAAGARLIGVNNRNLRTLEVDVAASHRLARLIPKETLAISESGLRSRSELDRLRAEGYGAFLIGERFMTDPDPAGAVGGLIGALVPRSRGAGGAV